MVHEKRQRLEKVTPDFAFLEPFWSQQTLVDEMVTIHKGVSTTIPFSVRPFFPKGGGSAKLWWTFKYQSHHYT